MNERIKELAEQNFYYGSWEGEGVFTGQIDLEKFAKLIVQECLSYAKDGDLDFMKFMIKEHFGVTEEII